jgi:HSP20 family protein
MTIMRWEPFRELQTLQGEMNRLFNTAFDPSTAGSRGWVPAMDLFETAEAFVLRADLPGLRQEDVKIEVEDNHLTLSGERARDPREGQDGFFRLERPSGPFTRTLTLPKGVDAEAISASFGEGVLEVHLPKPEQAKPRRIEIRAGDKPATIEA